MDLLLHWQYRLMVCGKLYVFRYWCGYSRWDGFIFKTCKVISGYDQSFRDGKKISGKKLYSTCYHGTTQTWSLSRMLLSVGKCLQREHSLAVCKFLSFGCMLEMSCLRNTLISVNPMTKLHKVVYIENNPKRYPNIITSVCT